MSIALAQLAKLAFGHITTGMQPVTETRLVRLQMLVKKHNGSLADLNEAIGLTRTDATLSQIRTRAPHSKTGKPRVMGDDLARKIEEKLKLPVGWMDTPPSYAELHDESDVLGQAIQVMEKMPVDLQQTALRLISTLAIPQIQKIETASQPAESAESPRRKIMTAPRPNPLKHKHVRRVVIKPLLKNAQIDLESVVWELRHLSPEQHAALVAAVKHDVLFTDPKTTNINPVLRAELDRLSPEQAQNLLSFTDPAVANGKSPEEMQPVFAKNQAQDAPQEPKPNPLNPNEREQRDQRPTPSERPSKPKAKIPVVSQ